MNDHGNVVCAYNRTPDKVTKFLENEAKNTNVSPYRMIYLLCTKGGLILESYSIGLQSSTKCAKNYPEHLFFRWVELKIIFGTLGD
jgi:hypothetical protein